MLNLISRKSIKLIYILIILSICFGCSDASDLVDLATDDPDRQQIDVSRMGVNSFFVNQGFGSIDDGYRDINQNLGINSVRILFSWSDSVQATPNTPINFDFFDRIVAAIPAGMDVVIVVAHTPNWMTDSSNWIRGNPRITWVQKWLRILVERYKDVPGIIAWQVWNEPDLTVVPSDLSLGLEDPQNYLDLLVRSFSLIRDVDPTALVVSAATSSINQNFPNALDYNKELRTLGVEAFADVLAVHYYGTNFETVVTSNGVGDFLNSTTLPLWITESGKQGVNDQLAYVETVWPFLREEIPGIDRIYYYEYSSTQPPSESFGLRNNDATFPVSDLYVYLRDRIKN